LGTFHISASIIIALEEGGGRLVPIFRGDSKSLAPTRDSASYIASRPRHEFAISTSASAVYYRKQSGEVLLSRECTASAESSISRARFPANGNGNANRNSFVPENLRSDSSNESRSELVDPNANELIRESANMGASNGGISQVRELLSRLRADDLGRRLKIQRAIGGRMRNCLSKVRKSELTFNPSHPRQIGTSVHVRGLNEMLTKLRLSERDAKFGERDARAKICLAEEKNVQLPRRAPSRR